MRNVAIVLLMIAGTISSVQTSGADESIALVPKPMQMERKAGLFTLKSDTAILFDKNSGDADNVAKQLSERIHRGTGIKLTTMPSDDKTAIHNAIHLSVKNADTALGPEGYTLSVTAEGVKITAADGPGLFYGMQTLLQLLPPEVFGDAKTRDATVQIAWTIPAVEIQDQPRFKWRGLLLDIARHFFDKQEIKQFLDLMAQHKLNTLQLHLTDAEGWRIEIKKYPKLTEVGAWRKNIGWGLDPKSSTAYNSDGQYGGFFTQDDIREIVAYAKSRYITIVPEIEMPGHCGAALLAYPEFSCTGKLENAFCAGNDAMFEFLENVLGEVIAMFPDSKYIHIGGDELKKDNWKKCPKCQARIKNENLKDENELQSYFVRRIEKFLNGKGKTLIGWDEILEGGLAPNATVMSWRGINGGIAAAKAGHDVVMTPTTHCYFDFYYVKGGIGEPKGRNPALSVEQVYSFEPVPMELPADKAKHILGLGCNTWTEYIPNFAVVQYRNYPRACASCEVGWTDAKLKDWTDFSRRLETHLKRLKAQGVNYRDKP